MSDPVFNPTFNEAALAGRLAWLDLGSSNASIQIYSTPQPSPGASPGSAILLATVILDKPCGTIASEIATLIQESAYDLASATGIGFWGRVLNGNGVWACDALISVEGGGAPIQLDATQIYAGGKVALVSAVFQY